MIQGIRKGLTSHQERIESEEKTDKNGKDRCMICTNGLVPASECWAMLCVAIAAIDWSALCRLERNFTFLAAIRTDGLMHLSGCPVEHHYFTSFLLA